MMKIGKKPWLQKEKLQLNVDHLQKKQLQREKPQSEKQLQREKQLLKERQQSEKQLQREKPQSEDDNTSKTISRHLRTICFPFSNFCLKTKLILQTLFVKFEKYKKILQINN